MALVDTMAREVGHDGYRRRRRWTAEDKRRIVEETRASGASVSVVARRHDPGANRLLEWRREAEAGQGAGALTTAKLPDFVPIGVVGRAGDGGPALLAGMPGIERALAVPMKRFDRPLLGFLSRGEMQAILDVPDARSWVGMRDRALLTTL
jgi:hypothetical protein